MTSLTDQGFEPTQQQPSIHGSFDADTQPDRLGATPVPPAPQNNRRYPLRIEFTGSGSEYFRIWIVNLLLLIVTLGIYYPWAKVRRLQYFHGNTLVDGEPLGFHGNPKKMLKGYLLVGLLFGLYSAAGQFSPLAGLIALVIVMAIWPALLKSAMQFRLANTSWRGLRFSFKGSVEGAYRAVLPFFIPSLFIVAGIVGVADPEKPPLWYIKIVGVVMVLSIVAAPWLMFNLKQYQHNHYGFASLRTTFNTSVSSFYNLFVKLMGVTMVPMLVASVVIGVGAGIAFATRKGGLMAKGNMTALMVLGGLLVFFSFMSTFVVIKPWITARMQNLVWRGTNNASVRFFSDLRFRSVLGLTLKNWFLILLTLGLYWPFAAVAMARLRLEAVSLELDESPETLISHADFAEGEAAGDAAGDLFGLDIGL